MTSRRRNLDAEYAREILDRVYRGEDRLYGDDMDAIERAATPGEDRAVTLYRVAGVAPEIRLVSPGIERMFPQYQTATHARDNQVAGGVHDPVAARRARDADGKTPFIASGEHHWLLRYETGSLVLIPEGDLWRCYQVADNPCHTPSPPGYSVPMVSFDEFNVRRHGGGDG